MTAHSALTHTHITAYEWAWTGLGKIKDQSALGFSCKGHELSGAGLERGSYSMMKKK